MNPDALQLRSQYGAHNIQTYWHSVSNISDIKTKDDATDRHK